MANLQHGDCLVLIRMAAGEELPKLYHPEVSQISHFSKDSMTMHLPCHAAVVRTNQLNP